MKKGVNKYGIKLEDFNSYRDYKNACNRFSKKSEKSILARLKYIQSEKGKLSLYNAQSKYIKTEKGRLNKLFNVNKRRSAKLQRTPPWADLKAIKQFYANCPKGYHVDHIVPLQGDNVSGFHVLNNLQYLSASENRSKGNKYAI